MTNDKEKEQREELKHRFVSFLEKHPTAFPSPEEIDDVFDFFLPYLPPTPEVPPAKQVEEQKPIGSDKILRGKEKLPEDVTKGADPIRCAEVLINIFPNAKELDWYKPIMKAMQKYASQERLQARNEGIQACQDLLKSGNHTNVISELEKLKK